MLVRNKSKLHLLMATFYFALILRLFKWSNLTTIDTRCSPRECFWRRHTTMFTTCNKYSRYPLSQTIKSSISIWSRKFDDSPKGSDVIFKGICPVNKLLAMRHISEKIYVVILSNMLCWWIIWFTNVKFI